MPRRKSTHVDDPSAVGRRLRDARERVGVSQRQLSFEGCSPAYISRIEAGERIPSLQLLREMGRRLGVSEDYLATGLEREAGGEDRKLLDAEVSLRLGEIDAAERMYGEVRAAAETSALRSRACAGLGQIAFERGEPRQAETLRLRSGSSAARSGWRRSGRTRSSRSVSASCSRTRTSTARSSRRPRSCSGRPWRAPPTPPTRCSARGSCGRNPVSTRFGRSPRRRHGTRGGRSSCSS